MALSGVFTTAKRTVGDCANNSAFPKAFPKAVHSNTVKISLVVFFLALFRVFRSTPLVPVNDPFLAESLHYHH
ncbi:MAG: hypothetical protein A3G20_00040 [Acidobacteria bacterium RIFCSPLOWO2_12_FULL_59_11]|nr:MAG: hypothetical protein A3G20_00040 [Acidobacteria bacterium RIFCSPLOWO2_12_FULL_59_11]